MQFLNVHEPGEPPEQGSGARILVVDDEARLRRSLALLLDKPGREIDECGTGAEAMTALSRQRYDLLLLDLRLPDMTGLDLMDWLGARLPSMTVIVVSADDVIDSAIGALRRGAYDFVRKPYQPEELLRTVDNALQRKHLERTNAVISARLEQSERLHRYLVDHSPDIIYTVDEQGRFGYLNPTVAAMLGLRARRAGRTSLLGRRARGRRGARALRLRRAAHRRARLAQRRAAAAGARTARWTHRSPWRCPPPASTPTSPARAAGASWAPTAWRATSPSASAPRSASASRPITTSSPIFPTASCSSTGSASRWCRRAATAGWWRCCSSTSIASSWSTTRSATPRATSCSRAWPRGCRPACAAATRWRAWAGTSSPSCCRS